MWLSTAFFGYKKYLSAKNMKFPWHLYLMAGLYILAGLNHFRSPFMYLRIMPTYLPSPRLLVTLSGLAEIALGVGLLFQVTKNYSIYGIILMLLIFLLIHVHMLTSEKAAMNLPNWVLIFRLLLQFPLIYWAYSYLQV